MLSLWLWLVLVLVCVHPTLLTCVIDQVSRQHGGALASSFLAVAFLLLVRVAVFESDNCSWQRKAQEAAPLARAAVKRL